MPKLIFSSPAFFPVLCLPFLLQPGKVANSKENHLKAIFITVGSIEGFGRAHKRMEEQINHGYREDPITSKFLPQGMERAWWKSSRHRSTWHRRWPRLTGRSQWSCIELLLFLSHDHFCAISCYCTKQVLCIQACSFSFSDLLLGKIANWQKIFTFIYLTTCFEF